MTGIIVLLVALVAALIVGAVLRSRSGAVRAVTPGASRPGGDPLPIDPLLSAFGVGAGDAPMVLHLSAQWCGPCSAVRRVAEQVVDHFSTVGDDRPVPRDVEVDIDDNPALAKKLGVLSLPTTFVFDAAGVERFRVSGVPKVADLTAALAPLRCPEDSLS
ncbi:thioredoxin family protein [Rhodococcus chondri]|uniref:Thioredoxin family protein n=1 Tax=Rhodococcus chondri TaxID=3065941 RepID=A0ABU7JRI2_9NOCA|nr:thioredoxin family protein [Rhodococcus sp. CC-R104]MEE2032114.1 thioredoxin family protein [Rhodococcus sp. CC-R104]